jgi:L-ribulose-5-phosphate 3-epimerase
MPLTQSPITATNQTPSPSCAQEAYNPAMNRRTLLKTMPAVAGLLQAAPPPAPEHPSRLRAALCAYSYRDALKAGTMTYQDVVRIGVETGMDGIDVTTYWFPNTTDAFLLPLRAYAYRNAMELYSIAIRTEMCQQSPDARAAQVETIKKWVDVAQKLGAGHVRVFGGNVPKGATEDQAIGWTAETLKRASEYAGSKAIVLGMETHGGITDRAETTIRIIKMVDSPWAGINLDIGNFRVDGYRQTELGIPYAVNVHFKTEIAGEDGKNQPADWNRLFAMFAAAGYKGRLALEYEANAKAEEAVPKLLRELRAGVRKYSA